MNCTQGKKRERSPEKECKKDNPHSRNLTNINKEVNSNKEQINSNSNIQQQLQPSHPTISSQQSHQSHSLQPTIPAIAQTFSAYYYGVPEQNDVDPNQRSLSMMTPFNMYAAMNPQWPSYQMDGMGMPPNTMQASTSLPVSSGMDMIPSTSAGINPYAAYMPMTGDMYGMMGNYLPYPMYPPDNSMMIPPVKETITLSSCVLYPPHPGQHFKTRERHPGCKTVFVGGLPEKISEEIVREIFSRCGEISTVRMSKKNFCHVRFIAEAYVDQAMMLLGYRLKIENKDESAYSGRLHVDFAKASDDEYEWECLQRALQREARHRERKEQEALNPPTPPPVVYYSEHEANLLTDKLKSKEHFKSATHVLITWLERGECNKKTFGSFYSMIKCAIFHLQTLFNEKEELEEKMSIAKEQMQQKMTYISLCFNEIYKVFETIQSLPSSMDIFTKAQRKEIEIMRKKTLMIIKTHSRELVEERVEDEMELSEGEEEEQKSSNISENTKGISKDEVRKLREEVEELRTRYQNAVEKNATLKIKMESTCNTYAQILQEKKEAIAKQAELSELEKFKEEFVATQGLNTASSQSHDVRSSSVDESGNSMSTITQHEMCLIALIATFLNVHPFG
ncbi:ecto-NOX disulfide-thiol exchanger 2 isoform X1 [Parasteatoda tepidariorum]|uniref:ecto-NOX disulfide-thiol exchanger 2 isoform X1 n=1 Tax=Parasteatoda tepidariorum TaxID=114398 RepID=UPI001C71FCFC|nr:ecto-NOX disulfide-thiol exchanger 2 isoform X1 [Parasteatoda tepidariorum]XP_042902688.1 ecto-NOX disulfide-thiol exchanger 2 isoform X1 [Parasteatoda tepidariorum]